MTVNTQNITSGPYTGNGVTTAFSYTFRVENKNQLKVYETDTAGVETLLTVDTNYTVAGIGADGGGTITRVAGALPSGYTWYIRSNYQSTQLTAFASQGAFFPAVHEASFDKLTFLIQQINDELGRALKLSESYSGSASAQIPNPEALKFVRWNAAGTALENVFGTTSAVASDVASDDGNVQTDLNLRVKTLSPMQYGASGDGVADDRAAVQSAINAAASTVSDFETESSVVVDLEGLSFGVGAPLVFDGLSNVKIQNGRMVAVGSWTSSDYMVDYTHTGAYKGSMNNTMDNVTIDCAYLCNGVYFQNTKRHRIDDANVIRFYEYGVRTSLNATGSNGELVLTGVTCTQTYENDSWIGFNRENDSGEGNGRGVGFSIRSADFMMSQCLAFKCMICFEADSQSNGQVTDCHFFASNRTTNDVGMTVSTAADNGSGLIRVTTAANHFSETGDLVYIDGVTGTTEANGWWKVTKISDTVVDLQGSTFSNAYVSGGAYHPYNFIIQIGAKTSEVQGLLFSNCYFDAQPSILWNSFDLTFDSCMFVAGGTSASKLSIITTSASTQGEGLTITSCRFKEDPVLDVSAGGSWASTPTMYFTGNRRSLSGQFAQLVHPTEKDIMVLQGPMSFDEDRDMLVNNFSLDYTTLKFTRGLRLSADYDNNSGNSQSNITLATDGSDRWSVTNAGNLTPADDVTYNVGGNISRLVNVFSQRFTLIDGVTAPSTIAGHAQIYVDSADGDLKIKFADGTVKTIVTDT